MPFELSVHVVGVTNLSEDGGNRLFDTLLCKPGDAVQLVFERKNPADPNTIAVLSERGIRIGYLTAERAPWIGSRINLGAGVEAVFQQQKPTGAAIQVNLEGEAPTLPAPNPSGKPIAPRVRQPRDREACLMEADLLGEPGTPILERAE